MAATPAVCEHLHYPAPVGQRPGAGAHAPRATPPSATSSGSPRPRRRSTTWPCRPTSSSASPARPRPTSSARSRSPRRPSTTTPTRSCSHPAPGTEAAAMEADFVDAATAGERFQRLRLVVERAALRQARGPGRSDRGGARRGPEQAGPVGAQRAGPARTSSCTSRRRTRCAPAATRRSRSRAAPRTSSRVASSSSSPSRPTSSASPSPPSESTRQRPITTRV